MPLMNSLLNILENLLTHPDHSWWLKIGLFIILGVFWTKVVIPRNEADRAGYVPPSNWILLWLLSNYFNTVLAFLLIKFFWYPLTHSFGILPTENFGLTYIWLLVAGIYVIWMETTYYKDVSQLYDYDFVRPNQWWKDCMSGGKMRERRGYWNKYLDFAGMIGETEIDGTPDDAVKQVFNAFSEWDLERLDNHLSEGYLEAETPLSTFSYGEKIRIELTDLGSDRTRVSIKVLPVRHWFFEPITAERRVRDLLRDLAAVERRIEYQT